MTQKLVIPDELNPIFDKYRGTGRFTVGAVMEYVHRHNVMRDAKAMNLVKWLEHAVELSREKGLIDGSDDDGYINENAEYWMDVWKDARNGVVLFNRQYSGDFESEGLLKIVGPNAASCRTGKGEMAEFDLVELPQEKPNGIQFQQEQEG